MNKTLTYIGALSLFIACLMYLVQSIVLITPEISSLQPIELLERTKILNVIALIFLIQGALFIVVGHDINPT